MSKPAKSIRRIFAYSPPKQLHTSLDHGHQTPKRKPIFSQQKYTTPKQIKHQQILPAAGDADRGDRGDRDGDEGGQREWKEEAVDFLRKMLARVESKNRLLRQLEEENLGLRTENQELERQNNEVLKKIAIFSGLDKLKQKNIEYRAKLIKAEGLLYQLRRSLKQPVKGIDELISSLHF